MYVHLKFHLFRGYYTPFGLHRKAKNISFQAVSLWERGETSPEIDKLPEIASLLHVTTDWLLMGKEEDSLVLDMQESLSDRLFNEDKMYTYVKTDAAKDKYYSAISENPIATIVKLLDRCNNVSGMCGCFSRSKIIEYISETERWVYPLYRKAKVNFPMYSNQLFLIKYHMTSVVESVKHQL